MPGQPDSLAVQDTGRNVDVVLPSVQSESAFAAPIRLFQGQFQFRFLIGAGNRPVPATAAEHLPEEVLEVDAALATDTATEVHPSAPAPTAVPAAAEPAAVPTGACPDPFVVVLGHTPEVGAEPVVAFPGVRVGQHLVGLVGLLEPVLRSGVLVHVGVILAGQLAVGLLDFVGAGAARDPERFVVVTRHGAHSSGRLTTTVAGRNCCPFSP